MTSFAPIPEELPDGWYRARSPAGAILTLRCTGGVWFNRFGHRVTTPTEYAPLDRRAA